MAAELYSQTNTFGKGMDMDTDITMLQEGKYRYAENIRILTNDSGTNSVLQNIEDIYRYLSDDDLSNDLTGTVVLGITSGKAYNYYNVYTDIAWVFLKRTIDGEVYNEIREISGFDSEKLNSFSLYRGKWGVDNEVQMIVNYERENICKLYIVDGVSPLLMFNVAKNYNIVNDDLKQYQIIPSCMLPPFILTELVDGALPACQIQYCYQLFNKNDKESTTSSLSSKIPIVPSFSDLKSLSGYEENSVSNRGCKLKTRIYNPNLQMQYIRIFSIQYLNATDTPNIYIINESKIPLNSEWFDFEYVDNGQNFISQITIEEFNDLIPFNFVAQTIAKKDNRLFAANIRETIWDVDYDARAYRCNKNGTVKLVSSDQANTLTFTHSNLLNGLITVPEDHDCINPLNTEIAYPEAYEDDYSYYKDGNNLIFGGEGLNIKYEFVQLNLLGSDEKCIQDDNTYKLPYTIDNNISTTTNILYGRNESTKESITINLDQYVIPNHADPMISANYLSYQRDELYRFGIIFYNEKNIVSPVHWIGDIRFPSSDQKIDDNKTFKPFIYNSTVQNVDSDSYNGAGNELIVRVLGLKFTVNNIPDEVKAYEIVRCRRTSSDRTIVAQGALCRTCNFKGWTDDEDIDYEWSGGNTDVRPYMFPNFANTPYIQSSGSDITGEGSYPGKIENGYNSPNDKIYQFISGEQAYNKTSELIKNGYYIVPLYCASHLSKTIVGNDFDDYTYWDFSGVKTVYSGKLVGRTGVQFNVRNSDSDEPVYNYFGQIVGVSTDEYNSTPITKDTADRYVVIDGPNAYSYNDQTDGKWYIPAGLLKFYKIYDKKNASNMYSLNRKFYLIEDAVIPTNISPSSIALDCKEIRNTFIDYVGDYGYRNITVGGSSHCGLGGISTILNCPTLNDDYVGIKDVNTTDLWNDNAYGVGTVMITNIKKASTNQYGGNTYSARQNSIYQINCTHVDCTINKNNSSLCFNGDTYLTVMDYTHSYLYYPNDTNAQDYRMNRCFVEAYIPLESTINFYYRNDSHFSQSVSGNSAQAGYMSEPGINSLQTQDKPAYTYNACYSNTMGGKSYITKRIFQEDDTVIFNRIACSELKENGEITDNWTKFKFANYLDVDNQYGPITNLKSFNNKLYFFQDEAVGIASINERSLITDNNASLLVLGTGGVLTRYDYVTILNGTSKIRDKSITNSNSTLYWYDIDKNVICALNNTLIELSKDRQVQSYLNKLPLSDKNNAVSFYDQKYNEVWFNIANKPLIFNEQLNCFTSFYTHSPQWAATFSNQLVTLKDNQFYYIHNIYDLNSSAKEDRTAKLQFVVNKDILYTKVYDNVMFSADFESESQNANQVLQQISFSTKTQNTTPINYTKVENREDNYRFYIPREEQKDQETQERINKSYAGRMRGKYLICNYIFDCNNKDMKIPFIKTTYRYSLV